MILLIIIRCLYGIDLFHSKVQPLHWEENGLDDVKNLQALQGVGMKAVEQGTTESGTCLGNANICSCYFDNPEAPAIDRCSRKCASKTRLPAYQTDFFRLYKIYVCTCVRREVVTKKFAHQLYVLPSFIHRFRPSLRFLFRDLIKPHWTVHGNVVRLVIWRWKWCSLHFALVEQKATG